MATAREDCLVFASEYELVDMLVASVWLEAAVEVCAVLGVAWTLARSLSAGEATAVFGTKLADEAARWNKEALLAAVFGAKVGFAGMSAKDCEARTRRGVLNGSAMPTSERIRRTAGDVGCASWFPLM